MQKAKPIMGLCVVVVLLLSMRVSAMDKGNPFHSRMELKEKPFRQGMQTKEFNIPYPWSFKEAKTPATVMAGSGAISGWVTRAQGGGGIGNVAIIAYQLECPFDLFQGYTDSDGFYLLGGLPPGHYFLHTINDSGFADVFYNDKSSWETADTVTVSSNEITGGIDFSLRVGGKITGTLTLSGYYVVAGWVFATDTASLNSYGTYVWNSGGESASYTIRGLPTGNYKVNTQNSSGYVDAYYDNKSGWATADVVSITEGVTTSGIDFTLNPGGTITGNVSTSAKDPLPGTEVFAYYAPNPEWVQFALTDMNGDFTLIGLREGWWKILAYGDTTYAFEWYDNKDTWDQADSVLVTTAKKQGMVVDFALAYGAAITGLVLVFGSMVPGHDVYAYYGSSYRQLLGKVDGKPSPFQPLIMKWDTTKADGTYLIGGLRTGDYVVSAYIECDQLFYDNQTSWENADLVHVTMPDTTPDINFNFSSAVEDQGDQASLLPAEFELRQNYPNPFNPGTEIEYTLRKSGKVILEIYNLLGQKVRTLVREHQSPGFYHLTWDGKNERGEKVSSGIYFYRLEMNGAFQTKRMVLLK